MMGRQMMFSNHFRMHFYFDFSACDSTGLFKDVKHTWLNIDKTTESRIQIILIENWQQIDDKWKMDYIQWN